MPRANGPVSLSSSYNSVTWKNESGTTISNSAIANLASGYYEVIVTDNNGCTGNETFYVGTYGQPDVTISTPDFGNFCANGGSMMLYALETSSGPLDYEWYHNGSPFGGTGSSQVVTQEGSYYVLVTDINGCTDFSNTLYLNCVDLPGPPSVCLPDGYADFEMSAGVFCNQSEYTNTSLNDVDNTWNWRFIDVVGGGTTTSSLENPNHTWTNAGFNIVIFTVGIKGVIPGEVCVRSVVQFDTIPLVANYIFEGACINEPISFTDISTFIPQTNITAWDWDFGDPASGAANTSNLQNPEHSYSASGSYTVSLTVTDESGCVSIKQQIVEIVEPPLASFSIPTISCEGASLLFEANGNFTDVFWDFGDPTSGAANTSTVAQSNHVFTNPGIYTVTLSVENIYGCQESVSEAVTIEANDLTGVIQANPGFEVCEGDSVILTAPLADTYSWSTGESTASITVFDAGSYKVTVYDSFGCGYTPPEVVIDLIPLPQGEITSVEYNEYGEPVDIFYNSYETCFGNDVYLMMAQNPIYTYEWPNGETSNEVSFTDDKDNLLAVGTHVFEVDIRDVTTGCTNTIGPFTVTVHPVPEDILIASMPSAPVCENTPTVISVVSPDPSYTYIWNTGEVGTSINTFYAGIYFVRAVNEFNCEAESNTLEIVPGPNVDLIPSGCHTRCNPDTICLPPVLGVSSFQWYLDGLAIPAPEGNDPNYIATESGEYYVEMVSVDGCVTISDFLTLDLYDGFGSLFGEVYFDINGNGIIDAADTLMSGIDIILLEGGVNVDTLTSNQTGSFAFVNILSTDYEIIVDQLNLPPGMSAIISQANALLEGCDDEESVEFLIEFVCTELSESISLSACPGQTVSYNGTDLNVGDVQDFDFLSVLGCDSTVTVTVNPLSESTNSVMLAACENNTIDYNGTALAAGSITDFTFTNALGCDSIVTVTVLEMNQDSSSIQFQTCNGTTIDYNGTDLSPGTQMDFTFSNADGCDSIVTVIVDPFETYTLTENLEACEGQSINYNGTNVLAGEAMTFNYTTINNCDSIITVVVAELLESSNAISFQACTGSTVDYNGMALSGGTVTEFAFENALGCDSIVTVTVVETNQDSSSIQLQTCIGSTIDYNGTDLNPGTQTDFMFTNIQGCDSIITVIVDPFPDYSMTENLEACEGGSVDYNGINILAGESMVFNFTTVDNCDSTVTVVVAELFETSGAVELMACENSTVLYDGTALSPGSVTDFTFLNSNNCDSIVTVTVGVLYESINTINLEACIGSTIEYNGTDLDAGTQADFMFTNIAGCDSIVTVIVSPLNNYALTENLEACEGESVSYNGTDILAGESMVFNFATIDNCDSMVTVIVAELLESTESIELQACENSTVVFDGTELLPGSTTDFIFENSIGCDSVVSVFVEELFNTNSSLELEACQGSTVIYEGIPLSPGTNMDFTFENADGCDSIVAVSVAELPLYNFDMELSACEGSFVEYVGDTLIAGSTNFYTFTSVDGCDSTMTIYVETMSNTAFTLNVSACDGATYPFNGDDLPAGSSTDYIMTNTAGCDSLVTVNVATYELSESFLDFSVCPGETINYNGNDLSEGFEDTFIFTDINGCDSIVTVNVVAYPEFEFEVNSNASCWNDNNGILTIENLSGGVGPFQYSINGITYQDSVIFENIGEGEYSVSVLDANGCEEVLETDILVIPPLEMIPEIPEVPCDFSPVMLALQNYNQNTGPITYLWEDGTIESFILVDTPGVFNVIISNACETLQESYTVPLAEDARRNYFYVPNLFSPNNDGMNDIWQIMPPDDMEVLSFELMVFDRWGNHLKTFETVYDSWDGSFKNEDLNPGVYVWWYKAKILSCGQPLDVFRKGDVTIVK